MTRHAASAAPAVSVVIPLFNAERLIGAAVESLRAQSLQSWEAVIIDDGSTDNSAAAARSAAAGDTRITLLAQPNRGLSAARNAGIDRARGRWVHFLDADDWMLPHGLETLVRLAESSSDRLACAGSEWFDELGDSLGFTFEPGTTRVSHEHLRRGNRFGVHAALVGRDLLNGVRFDDSLGAYEDWDLWLRLTSGGSSFLASPEPVAAYRLRPQSMSHDPMRMLRAGEQVLGKSGAASPHSAGDRRTRCRLALEQLAGLLLDDEASHAVALAGEIARQTGAAGSDLIADVLHWRLPFIHCLPPTAWRSDRHVALLAEHADTLLHLLTDLGVAPKESHRACIEELARRCVPADAVAAIIAARIPAGRRVVLHALGRNAGALIPRLAGLPRELLGIDDAERPGQTQVISGRPVRLIHPVTAPGPGEAVHVVTVAGVPALERRAGALGPSINWSEIQADLSRAELARLVSWWPSTDAGARAGVIAHPPQEAAA